MAMDKLKKMGRKLLQRANKKRLRRSRSMPFSDYNLEGGPSGLYNHPNACFLPAADVFESHEVETENHDPYELLPPPHLKILERLERENEIQYHRDVAAYKLENRNPLMLHYRYETTPKPVYPANWEAPAERKPLRGELQWNWNFPEHRKSKRSSARYSKDLKTKWHMNASCENISPLTVPKDWESTRGWNLAL